MSLFQTSSSRPLTAILIAIQTAAPNRDLLIYTDSMNYITVIDTVHKLKARSPLQGKALRCDLANTSIYLAINDGIAKRLSNGYATSLQRPTAMLSATNGPWK